MKRFTSTKCHISIHRELIYIQSKRLTRPKRKLTLALATGKLLVLDAHLSDVRFDGFGFKVSHWVLKTIQTNLVTIKTIFGPSDGENGHSSVRLGDSAVSFHANYFAPNLIHRN